MSRFIVCILTSLFAAVVSGLQVSVRVGGEINTDESIREVQPTELGVRPATEAGAIEGAEDRDRRAFAEFWNEDWVAAHPDAFVAFLIWTQTYPDWYEDLLFHRHRAFQTIAEIYAAAQAARAA